MKKIKKIVYDKNEFPIAPNGWCGFVKNTYLSKTVRDPETNKPIKSFKKFDEAVAKAEELKEYCSGDTLRLQWDASSCWS